MRRDQDVARRIDPLRQFFGAAGIGMDLGDQPPVRATGEGHRVRAATTATGAGDAADMCSVSVDDVEGVRNLVGTGLAQLVGGTVTAVIAFVFLVRGVDPCVSLYPEATYTQLTEAALSVEGCESLTLWGVLDRYSWVPGTFPGEGAATVLWDDYSRKLISRGGAP